LRFPLTQALLRESETYSLRSACGHCFFNIVDPASGTRRCANEWPDEGQSRWPLDARREGDPPDGPTEAQFCKEFELA
jgi:hypothetical protein